MIRRHMRRVALVSSAVLALAGCSSEALPTRTDALPRGASLSAQGYLNDAAGATSAIRAFSATVATAGEAITPAEARQMAPTLTQQAAQARAMCNRLGAQRLEDSRLEAQRTAIVAPLSRVCTSMEAIARLAGQGNVRAMATRLEELPAQLAELRTQGLT